MRIEEKIAYLFIEQKMTLCVAESCTGGLLSHSLTNVPGSSKFFLQGLITYSNASKNQLLDIPLNLLKKHGAVSEQIAENMARQIRILGKSDFGLSITGIAGPTGGTQRKPVGLTYIAINTEIETLCVKCIFSGSRIQIKNHAVKQALKLLLEFLE